MKRDHRFMCRESQNPGQPRAAWRCRPTGLPSLFFALSSALLFGGPAGVTADTLHLDVGFWPGSVRSELEGRYAPDDRTISENGSRENEDWQGSATNVYPIALAYESRDPFLGFTYVAGARYFEFAPRYHFSGLAIYNSSPTRSDSSLANYRRRELEYSLGVVLANKSGRVKVTPRLGFREHERQFDYRELALSEGGLVNFTFASPFYAYAAGPVVGVELVWLFAKSTGMYLDAAYSKSSQGRFSQMRSVVNFSGPNVNFLTFEQALAGFELRDVRGTLAVQHRIRGETWLRVGWMTIETSARYPGYRSLPLMLEKGVLRTRESLTELLLDTNIYGSSAKEIKSNVFVSVIHAIQFRK